MKCLNAYDLREFLNSFNDNELRGAALWTTYSEDVESGVVIADESRSKKKKEYGRLDEIQIIGSADDI